MSFLPVCEFQILYLCSLSNHHISSSPVQHFILLLPGSALQLAWNIVCVKVVICQGKMWRWGIGEVTLGIYQVIPDNVLLGSLQE